MTYVLSRSMWYAPLFGAVVVLHICQFQLCFSSPSSLTTHCLLLSRALSLSLSLSLSFSLPVPLTLTHLRALVHARAATSRICRGAHSTVCSFFNPTKGRYQKP